MKSRRYPEIRGSRRAARLERERARNELKRQVEKKAKKLEGKTAMQTETVARKERSYTQKRLTAKDIEAIERLVLVSGELAVLNWLARTPRALVAQSPLGWARATLRGLRDPKASHKSTLLDVAADLLANFGKAQTTERVQAVPVPIDVTETRVVSGTPETPAKPEHVEFNGRTVRVIPAAEPVFVARDLVEAVGATWSGHSLDHIPAEYRGVVSVSTPFGTQQMVCLAEAGMNMYLFRSDKPAALPWQRHLAEDVLPQIRKTGTYTAPGAAPQLPPATIDYQAIGSVVGAAVSTAVATAMAPLMERLLNPPRRLMIRRENPAQQTIPQTDSAATPSPAEPPRPPDPTAVQKLRASGRLSLLPVPGKVHARDVCDAIHRMVKTVSEVSGWHYEDLFNGVYDRIQIEVKWNPRERPASEKSALKYIGSQSQERKLECYRIAYEVLVAPYIG